MQYSFDENGSDLLYTRASVGGPGPFHTFTAPVKDANGKTIGTWPCQKPPWGLLNAVDVKTGNIAWQVPLGITEQLPAAKAAHGRSGNAFAGPTATAGGLVFTGEMNGDFDAFDARSGEKLWHYPLGSGVCTPPITYKIKGVQYIAVGAGGCHGGEVLMHNDGRPNFGDVFAIFALPEAR